ncbi:MAG: hypothetical protein OEQ29_10565 [Alphaproteobacteria bacterium]|nr:hypothetical protein [Alphaproteobacteria bacterium]
MAVFTVRRFVPIIAALIGACTSVISQPRMTFVFFDTGKAAKERFVERMRTDRRTVDRYFYRQWGLHYDKPLRIRVSYLSRISKALIPSWRGERGLIQFPVRRVRQDRAATIHELVHVYAPNQNRFLAEGLAVHLHHALGGNPAFPNFGKPLHRAARSFADIDLPALDAIATPRRLRLSHRVTEREAYIVAGSFTMFLIDRYGLAKFRRLYELTPLRPRTRGFGGEPRRYEGIYGKSLDQLASEWRACVASEALIRCRAQRKEKTTS